MTFWPFLVIIASDLLRLSVYKLQTVPHKSPHRKFFNSFL